MLFLLETMREYDCLADSISVAMPDHLQSEGGAASQEGHSRVKTCKVKAAAAATSARFEREKLEARQEAAETKRQDAINHRTVMAQLTASLDLATKTRNGQVAMKIKLMFKMSQQSNPTNSAAVLAHVEGLIEESNKEILKIQAAIDDLTAKILPTSLIN